MLKIIAALSENGVIGRHGRIPFRLSDDLKRFKKVTAHHAVAMGRKTYASLPEKNRPLQGRVNVVLTEMLAKDLPGATVVRNFESILEASRSEDLFVIGGAEVYRMALPFAEEMYLTRVHAEVEGDTFFPRWKPEEWSLVSSERHEADDRNEFPFTWEKYVRRDRYIEMANCRTEEQRRIMREIRDTGLCPFCPENLERWHKKPILWSGLHWSVSENMWPYHNTDTHLMLFLKTHAESPEDMPTGAFEELSSVLRWAETTYKIKGAAFYMRFGECLWTGGTVRHIHAHLASKMNVGAEPVLFYLG